MSSFNKCTSHDVCVDGESVQTTMYMLVGVSDNDKVCVSDVMVSVCMSR